MNFQRLMIVLPADLAGVLQLDAINDGPERLSNSDVQNAGNELSTGFACITQIKSSLVALI